MKITNIEITNYKAFHGTHKITVGGKNLFVYGENGSGKSSLYYALKDFFQSSIEDIDLNDLKNIFVLEDAKGKTAIKVTFKPDSQGQNRNKTYQFTATRNDSRKTADTSIRDGNSLKSFLTYKHLIGVHHLKKDDSINLFDLLVKGVLQHFRYSLTRGSELGELWTEVEECIDRETGRQYPINKKKADVNGAIKRFNEAFGELFNEDSPEYILKHAGPILDKFNHNIVLNLRFSQVRPITDYASLEGAEVGVEISYAGKPIKKPHLFLNEARLSAIAISIYLGMKAEKHLKQCDYKATAVYIRSAFEKMICKYCEKKKKQVVFKSQLKKYTTEDFWKVIKADVAAATSADIEKYRSLVLNPFSHYNTERHEIKTELINAWIFHISHYLLLRLLYIAVISHMAYHIWCPFPYMKYPD